MSSSKGHLLVGLLTLSFLPHSLGAQDAGPREQFQRAVAAHQKTPSRESSLRVIELFKRLDPPPTVPEEAREPFVMGATVLKKAGDPAGAGKAVELFTQALNVAPWFAEAYYNRALARETAGQFEPAMDDLKLYLEFTLSDIERREALDKIYSLKADALLSSTKKTEAAAANAKEAATQAQEQRFLGAWRYPHSLGDNVPRLMVLNLSKAPDGRWSASRDFYINNKEVQKAGPFGAEELAFVEGELRFKVIERSVSGGICGTYDVRGSVSPDGRTLNLAYILLPFAPDRPDQDCPLRSSYGSYDRKFNR